MAFKAYFVPFLILLPLSANAAEAERSFFQRALSAIDQVTGAKEASEPCPELPIYNGLVLAEALSQLDQACLEPRAKVGAALKSFPKNLPVIELTAEEKKNLPANTKAMQDFEISLYKKYGGNLSGKAIGWHGRSSQQRIVWQDPEVQQLLQDPPRLRTLLYLFQDDQWIDYGENNSLASLVLFGLASNNPSYLLSAAPNWPNAPLVKGVSWKLLDDMGKVPSGAETPLAVTPEAVANARAACQQLGAALSNEPNKDMQQWERELNDWAEGLTDAELWTAVQEKIGKLTPEQVSALVGGEAGKSTELARMNGQALEVFSGFDALRKFHQGDTAAVLGYGFISHALDQRHMMAAIYGLSHGMSKYRKVKTDASSKELRGLFDSFGNGSLEPEAKVLLRARLKQVLTQLEREVD